MHKHTKQKNILSFLSLKQPKISHSSYIEEAKHIFISRPFSIPIRIFFLIVIIAFVMLGISFRALPPLIPLYYSLPWGDEQLARTSQLFLIPFTMLVVFLVNFLLILFVVHKDRFITLLILWGNCFFSLIGTITLFKIIVLVL